MTVRVRLLFMLLVVAAFGLGAKHYAGPGRWWVNNWGPASVAYLVFFILMAAMFLPRRGATTPISARPIVDGDPTEIVGEEK